MVRWLSLSPLLILSDFSCVQLQQHIKTEREVLYDQYFLTTSTHFLKIHACMHIWLLSAMCPINGAHKVNCGHDSGLTLAEPEIW